MNTLLMLDTSIWEGILLRQTAENIDEILSKRFTKKMNTFNYRLI